jgi:uncharacterized protein (DUF58 family)/tetratricopeptide (TPR) repeat protein
MRAIKTFRRAVACVLSAALVLGAPGGRAYQAAAQVFVRAPAVESAGRSGELPATAPMTAAPSISISPLGISPLSAPAALGSVAPAPVPAAAALAVPAAALAPAPASPAAAALPAAAVPAAPAEVPAARAEIALEVAGRATTARGAVSQGRPEAVRAFDSVSALNGALPAASVFDGAASRSAASESGPAAPPAASARPGSFLVRAAAAIALAAGLVLSPVRAGAQASPGAAQTTTLSAPAAAPPASVAVQTPQAPLPRPLVATLSADRSDATVGERIHLTLALRNTSAKSISVTGLREGLQDALPDDLEIQGKGAEAPLTLAPGEIKTVVYEVIPFASGSIPIKSAVAAVRVEPAAAYPDGIEIVLPDTAVVVKSVLTPDWKEKGLRDIVDVVRARGPNWEWIAGGAFGFLLLIGLERILAARRWYPKLDSRRLSLVVSTEAEIARLEAGAASMGGEEFSAAVQEAATRFMVDFAGLPRRERSAKVLLRDLKSAKTFRTENIETAADIAARAETARFSGADEDEAGRRRQLARLRKLVENVAGKARVPAPPERAGLNAFAGASGLEFGSPWALLLFIPFAAYMWKAWRARGAGERFAVSSAAQASAHRSWRERLAALPRWARASAAALLILALARPMIGVQRLESYTPSTDTMIVEDRSGSMDDKMGAGTKLDAAAAAIRAYVDEQRKGTQNRVGMETFNDVPYVDVRLTTDYDALISHLKEIKADGSTAIGEAILTGVGHFAEVNIMDLDEVNDPRVAQMKSLLREKGLAAALEYAKASPDLMSEVLRPDRAKVVVLFTDGESNTGIDPGDAAKIAASLGVKVYTVGVGDSFDEKTLRGVADVTKAQFYKAGDADRMTQVLLEISRLEKSPAKIVSSVSIKDYTAFLALLAFLLLGAEAALGNTRLRSLQAMILAVSLQGMPLVQTLSPAQFSGPAAPASVDAGRTTAVPAELAEGNRLYAEGRFADAVKKYAEAVAAHPDIPELYFNMADAYLRLGDVERAEQAYNKYLNLTPDPVKQSRALFNMGDAELTRKDADKAIEFYKEALRRDPGNQDAKWNLESLKKQQQEQQKDQKPGQKKGSKGQKGQNDKPQQGEPGQKGDQKGQPGQPGDQKGDPSDASKDPKGDQKKGADQLTSKLGDQRSQQDEAARKAITRNGSGVWAAMALPLAGIAGHGIVFASPLILAATAVGVPLAAVLIWYGLHRNAKAARELSPGTAPKTAGAWWGLRRHLLKSALFLGALGLIGLAATDPRGGAVDQRVNFGGKDLIVAVDGSYSFVYAEDGRMAEAKKDLAQFVERLQGTDRVGLVVFSGNARTASPISIDYGNFEYKINRLELESRGLKEGSDLGAAVTFAAQSFDAAKRIGDRQRVLIVVSDGEAFSSEIDAAVKSAKEHNVTIYAIGIGTAAGTKMKVPTLDGKGTEYLMDSKTGAPAVSRLDESTLRRLSESTGGAYFHAGEGVTIEKVMQAVAQREKGRQGDTIKSPQPVGTYLLWPALALLLLDLLLPGRSLLRRDVPEKKEEKKNGGGPAGMMGAALVPLAAWPQILPFALLSAAVSALILADVWNEGALTRGAREAWQRRTGFVAKGVRADLSDLYDLREIDEPRLAAFMGRWQAADDKARAGLVAEAAADEALWREKLTAAYLSGAGPDVHESVLTALRRASRDRLEPLKPVVARIAARGGELAWLEHADARARLAALQETADGQPFAVPLPPAPQPERRSLRSRLSRSASAGALIVSLAIGSFAVDGTMRFAREQAAAEQTAFQIFYGDDLYVFGDRYIDDRIPQFVLPVLRAWHKPVREAGPDFERAMQILRESPDPKADNLLVVAFRRAGLLPMDDAAETILLKALIERDSDPLWASMDRTIAQSGDDPAQAALLVKLVALGAEVGSEHAFMNLFRVLKSPNEQVRSMTLETLYGAMASAPDSAPFFPRLTKIGGHFASDPALQMWSAVFALRRAAAPDAAKLDGEQMRAFFDQLLANAEAIDAGRAPLFAAALAQAKQSGQEPQLPPSLLPSLLGLMDKFETQEQGQDAATPVPAATAAIARYVIARSVTDLIKEGEKDFPGLHARLLKDGVVLPDTEDSGSGGDYEIWMGEGGYHGGSSSSPTYREVYKLGHLRALQADLAAEAQAFQSDDAAKVLAAAEFSDRAQAALKPALSAGARAGMLEGDNQPEKVADELQPLLKDGVKAFNGTDFLTLLRARGLAPAIGDPTSALAYPETFDAAQLTALRGLFAEMAKDGKLPGAGRDLTWAEKRFVARGLDAVDAVRREYDPKTEPAAAGFERPDQDGVALARLFLAIEPAKDGDEVLGLERQLLARLAGPRAATATADDLKQLMPALLKTLALSGKSAEGWALFQKALDDGRLPPAAKEALRPQAFASLKELGDELEKNFDAQNPKYALMEADLKSTDLEWRSEFTLGQFDALVQIARASAAEAAKAPGGMTDDQKNALAHILSAEPPIKAFAVKLGVPAGDQAAVDSANLNKSLHLLYMRLPGTEFYDVMVQKGFAVAGGYDRAKSWPSSYTPDRLKALRAEMQAMLADGKWRGTGGTQDFSDEEKIYLRLAIKSADAMLARAKAPATALHGFAPLGVLLAGSAFSGWIFAALVAAAATWLIWKYAFRTAPAVAPSEEARAASVEARRSRIAFAARRLANSAAGGAFRSRFIGAGGSEFAEARPYQNEDYREIDWKTSAKKGETYAKKFELDRDMPLILLVDVSRSGRVGTRGVDKRTVIEDVAATLALAASRTNVRVGAILFSDRVEAVIPVRGGAKHAAALVDALMNAEPAGRETDLRPALEQVLGLSKSRAMVAVVSDFMAPDFKDALAGAAARHDLRAIRVVDPAETRPLPDVALLPLVDAESGARRTLDTGDKKVRADAATAIARREAKLEEDLLAARARPIVLSTEGEPLETLAAHFDPKGRNAAP